MHLLDAEDALARLHAAASPGWSSDSGSATTREIGMGLVSPKRRFCVRGASSC